MRSMLIMILAAGLVLLPLGAAIEAQETTSERPPIEQPLVSEGQFAVELANALGLSSSHDEAAAEDSLSRVNIAPRNGWIADYPVTPDILEEVRDSAAGSASAGAIKMSAADAARTVDAVSSALNLLVREKGDSQSGYPSGEYGSASAPPPAYGAPGQYVEPTVIDGYYDDNGPPVVTYYAPPWDYAYMYDWVPYPFWWDGYYFGGFFILGDFNCVGGCYYDHHRGHHDRWANHRITNHVTGANGAVTRIDPVTRATGAARSSTVSRAGGAANAARFNSPGARAILDRSTTRNPGAAARNPTGFGGADRTYHGGAYSGAHSFSGTTARPSFDGDGSSDGASSSDASSRGAFTGGGFGQGSSGYGGGGGFIHGGGFTGGGGRR